EERLVESAHQRLVGGGSFDAHFALLSPGSRQCPNASGRGSPRTLKAQFLLGWLGQVASATLSADASGRRDSPRSAVYDAVAQASTTQSPLGAATQESTQPA